MSNSAASTAELDLADSSMPAHQFPLTKAALHFSTFPISRQIFYLTPLSFALVNLKPLLPGHVLVCPRRVVPRYTHLTPAELTDLSLVTQRVASTVERVHKASSLNIAVQDGKDAGQSVPHVHVHIIPRHAADLDDQGGTDAVYDLLEGEEGNIKKQLSEVDRLRGGRPEPGQTQTEKSISREAAKPDVGEDRKARNIQVMENEATALAAEMKKDWGTAVVE